MTGQDTNALALESVPDVASPVVIASEQETARDGEGDGGDTTKNVVVSERNQLAIRTNIEQSAGRIVRTGRESIAVGEEPGNYLSVPAELHIRYGWAVDALYCIDVGFMSNEGLGSLSASNVPEFGGGITGARYKDVLIGAEGQTKGKKMLSISDEEIDKGVKMQSFAYLITSPVWSLNSITRTPASMSQSIQVMSPEEVTIWRSLMNLQQER